MPDTREIPRKTSYKSSEVCQYTGTQPYVLRFWASEFPQLSPEKTPTGQPVYSRGDIDLILRIKQLLHEEEFTIEEARRRLTQEASGGASPRGTAPRRSAEEPPGREAALPEDRTHGSATEIPAGEPGQLSFGNVSRERYDDAVDEIAHLRLQLKEAETRLRRSENALHKTEETAKGYRGRYRKAIDALEQLLELLS